MPAPTDPGMNSFQCESSDGCTIRGWSYSQPDLREGTLVWIHGIGGGSSTWAPEWLYELRKQNNMCSAAFDCRGHGRSDYKTPTAGVAEAWDCSAVLDTLQKHDFPLPFILIGESMGAMVAGHVARTDERVAGAVCLMSPCAPLVGAKTVLPGWLIGILRSVVIDEYGDDLLLKGDLTFDPCEPAHKPRILHVIGEYDPFGWENTFELWKHWYAASTDSPFVGPAEAPLQFKYFLRPACGHDLSTWEPRYQVLNDFIAVAKTASKT